MHGTQAYCQHHARQLACAPTQRAVHGLTPAKDGGVLAVQPAVDGVAAGDEQLGVLLEVLQGSQCRKAQHKSQSWRVMSCYEPAARLHRRCCRVCVSLVLSLGRPAAAAPHQHTSTCSAAPKQRACLPGLGAGVELGVDRRTAGEAVVATTCVNAGKPARWGQGRMDIHTRSLLDEHESGEPGKGELPAKNAASE